MATRKVRTQGGVEKYNLPIGSVIGSGMPPFKPTKVVVHHSSEPGDTSRAIVSSVGPTKTHVTIHPNLASQDEQMDAIYDANPKLAHTFHNVHGRLFRVTGSDVHAQTETGAFEHVGTVSYGKDDKPTVTPTKMGMELAGIPATRKTHPTQADAFRYLVGDGTPTKDNKFAVTKKLREVIAGEHSKNMVDLKKGQTHTPDGWKIPPAWTQVEVAKNANYRLQVRGRDSLGKIQSHYSDDHTESASVEKFERVKEVQRAMPKLIKALNRQRILTDDAAAVVQFMRLSGARVDSTNSEKPEVASNNTGVNAYGATTMLVSHVRVSGNTVTVNFTGKRAKENGFRVVDKNLADGIRLRMEGKKPSDPLFKTDSSKTGAFIKQHLGVPTKRPNHDLRTHIATSMASAMVNGLADDDYPADEVQLKEWTNWVAEAVAEQLNDTPKVVLTSYIDPTVLIPLRRNLDGVE